MRRVICCVVSLLLLLPGVFASQASGAPAALTIDYSVDLLIADQARVTIDLTGASGSSTTLEFRGAGEIRNAMTTPTATTVDGRALPCSWSGDQALVVENGSSTRFVIHYTIDGIKAAPPDRGASVVFRPLAVFFTAANVLLIPASEPGQISVRFVLPAETEVFSSLQDENGVFVASPDLWGDLRYDFAKSYFTGGRPLFVKNRTTTWGDTYQYVWFDRDVTSMMWNPSYGDAPWEEAERYLTMTEQLNAYIRDHVMGPLPPHKVLFTNTKQGPTSQGVLTNVDWFHYMQIWPRNSEPEVAHHLLHQYTFWRDQTKLPLGYSGAGGFLNEGLATYIEQAVPAAVFADQSYLGKLFEFFAIEQRGQAFGIAANAMHVKYNRSALQVYLLDRYISQASGGQKDISAFARALWDRVKDRRAPQDIDDLLVTGAFAEVAGAGGKEYFLDVAGKTVFASEDFGSLLPAFNAYVTEMADRHFWGNRLLFLAFLDIAAAKGNEWPHYATYPHNVNRYREQALRPFKQSLLDLKRTDFRPADVEIALGAATGQDHTGFFAYWANLGIDLNPASLLPLTRWNPDAKDEGEFVVDQGAIGTLETEHYLSGLPQQATIVLDHAAPSQTILVETRLSSFDGFPPVTAATVTLPGQPEMTNQVLDHDLYVTQVFTRVTTGDPERLRFPVQITLPASTYHPKFQVYSTGAGGNKPLGFLYSLHPVEPVPFAVETVAGQVTLPLAPTPGAYFAVITGDRRIVAAAGETVRTGPARVLVDLLDDNGFLRGRQTLAGQSAVAFSDIDGHWARDAIARLSGLGIVGGNGDGTFTPNGTLTRAEFVKMLVGASDLKPQPGVSGGFSDTSGHWVAQQGYLGSAVTAGIVKPADYADNRFAPNLAITRDELAIMIVRALGLENQALQGGLTSSAGQVTVDGKLFTDADQWQHFGYVITAIQSGIVAGYQEAAESYSFRPAGTATRAEAVTMIVRMLDHATK